MKILKWLSITIFSLLTLAVIGIGVYLNDVLPSVKDIPANRLMAAPSLAEQYPATAYKGVHPSLVERPLDPFEYPIALGDLGPVEPVYARHNVYPFWCGDNTITGEAPEVDNQEGFGVPVFAEINPQTPEESPEILGYSKDCLHKTQAFYYFKSAQDGYFYKVGSNDHPIATITLNGIDKPFVARVEVGTINRHFYLLAALKGDNETLAQPNDSNWNGRLVYQFRGGVGIGKRQGNIKSSDVLDRRQTQLAKGSAVVYSSANQTSNHYNMWLAEETARRVKSQFVALYGEPAYTVGIGGSGGAIQQYLIAQNNPEILDAIIPLYSYPDMTSQIIYVLDCEPLEYFFEQQDENNERWQHWGQRSLVHGLSYDEELLNKFTAVNSVAALMAGQLNDVEMDVYGSNECVEGWRGLTPLVHNPNFVHFMRNFSTELAGSVQWTHWNDLRYFYGVDEHGYANSAWDNEGVQYGLQALLEEQLSVDEFLKINAQVGGWKYQKDLNDELLWLLEGKFFPVNLSFWSHQNLKVAPSAEQPAQRTRGSAEAIAGAYRSGHVFVGEIDVPILDVRHYLDDELDMHHAAASFSSRLRIQQQKGNYDNQVIWISHKDFNPIDKAFEVMDEWMMAIKANPAVSVAGNKPSLAEDTCLDLSGNIIAQGEGVWDGQWNGKESGRCTAIYPPLSNSREIAGGPLSGDVFKCHLQSINEAASNGVYGSVDMSSHISDLNQVFPTGVCDYRLGDAGRPADLFATTMVASNTVEPEQKNAIAGAGREVNFTEDLSQLHLDGTVISRREKEFQSERSHSEL